MNLAKAGLSKAFWKFRKAGLPAKMALALATYALYYQVRDRGLLPFKKNLDGEHVYITGAGNGLGKKMAILMAKQGAKITVADLDFDFAKETARFIKEDGGQAFAVKVNVANS